MVTNTLSVCGTKAMPRPTRSWGDRPVMSSPSSRTLPERSDTMPSSAFMAVDFPAPFGPTMTAISPRPTEIEQSWTMSAPP